MGYQLGVVETIAAVMSIGFSVDYTVHLGHIYTHSKGATSRDMVT